MRQWKRYPMYKVIYLNADIPIPEHWTINQTKRLIKTKISDGPHETPELIDKGVPFISAESIKNNKIDFSLKRGYISNELHEEYKKKVSPKRGDIFIIKSGATTGSIAKVEVDFEFSIWSPLALIRPNELIFNSEYAFYFFQSREYKDQVSLSWSFGTQQNIGMNVLERLFCVVPTISEQSAIASYLDRETARIDTLIEKKQRQIELLQEKRAALISQAVTKGLDPTVPMNDSGVPWLGKVPEHWEIIQLRRIIKKFVDYRGKTPEKVDSGITLVTAKNVKNGIIDLSLSTEYIREEEYEDWMVRGLPEIGDVLLTTEAPLGEVAQITDTQIALAQRIILLKSESTKILNEYLKFQLMSDFGKGELWSRATGSTAIGIKAEHLKSIQIILPPISEQKEIISYIIEKTEKLEQPLSIILNSINILQEYRSALISAAVTGKIDVREEATA